MPGSWLLALARVLFDSQTVTRLIEPTVADLRREVTEAGANRLVESAALFSGYAALWRVITAVTLRAAFRALHPAEFDLRSFLYHAPWVPLTVFLIVFMWQLLAWSLVPVVLVGLLFGAAIRRWNNSHPTRLAPPKRLATPGPLGINVAFVPISGNAGGLIFMIGSLSVLMLGLPALAVFLAAGALGGTVMAAALFAWHAAAVHQPQRSSPLGRLAR